MGNHEDRAELRQRIRNLIEFKGGGHNTDLVEDVVEQGLKLLHDVEHRGDARIIQTALRELRYAFHLFEPYSDTRKVSIFGSARTTPDKVEYQQAVKFSRMCAEKGWMVITGAGPGIMQAGNEGAGSEMSFGVNIHLPWEASANPVIEHDKKLINFKYFFTRKLTFIRHADAIALFPGGFGTQDEAFETLTLMQTGKSQLMPLVLIDKPGGTYWKTWEKHVKEHLLRNELISAEDLNLWQITDNPAEAMKLVTRFYRNYHSFRFVRGQLVIRMKNAPSETALAALNDDFGDIIDGEPIHNIETTDDEREDEDVVDLPRVSFGFDRKSYARLRKLIGVLNNY